MGHQQSYSQHHYNMVGGVHAPIFYPGQRGPARREGSALPRKRRRASWTRGLGSCGKAASPLPVCPCRSGLLATNVPGLQALGLSRALEDGLPRTCSWWRVGSRCPERRLPLSDQSGPCSLSLWEDFPEARMAEGCSSSRDSCYGFPNSLQHCLPPPMDPLN